MMRRMILLATLVLLFAGLLAQQDIQLPQVVITGETEIFSDSTSKNTDLSKYWSLENPSLMRYDWYPESSANDPEHADESSNGVIQGKLGNMDYGSLRVDFSHPTNHVLNFSGAFRTVNYDAGWEQATSNFHWQPSFMNHHADAYVDWSSYDSRLQNYTTQNTGFGFSPSSSEIKQVGPVRLSNPDFYIEYYLHKQDSEDSTLPEREVSDVNVRYQRDIAYMGIDSHLDVAYLKNMFTGSIRFLKKDFLSFDQLGLWVGGDGMHVYPSVWFLWQRQLLYQTNLKIMNTPYTGNLTRIHQLEQNPYQNIDMHREQPKAPLNLTTAFEFDTIFPITIYDRFTWIKDYPVYAHADSTLYEQFLDDVIWNRIGFDASYTYQRFDFVNEFSYHIVQNEDGDRIPFMPAIDNLFSLTYRQDDWDLTLQARYLNDRENDDETAMENVLLTNILGSWRFHKDFELNGGMYNLLDEDYRQYRELPAQGTRFEAGVCWYF